MNKIIEWVKQNKLSTGLIVVLGYFLLGGMSSNMLGSSSSYQKMSSTRSLGNMAFESAGISSYDMAESVGYSEGMSIPIMPEPNDASLIQDRKVTMNYDYSILVKNVKEAENTIRTKAEEYGGFVISSNVTTPYEGGSGYISVRIPNDSVEQMRKVISDAGLRVVNENATSSDITEAYYDAQARVDTLNKALTKLNAWFDEAENVTELINLQSNIDMTQSQLDDVNGRLRALEAKSQTTKIDISLSTDELALPYSPGQPWRPDVIFKMAVRELNLTLRDLGEKVIYLGVYSILWIPTGLIAWFAYKFWKKRTGQKA